MILSISIWSCTSSWQGGRGGVKLYYQLTYLVDFANSYYVLLYILLFCSPSCSLTLFGIILFFLGIHLNFFFLLFGLVSLAGRISGGLERTTSQRCRLHFQSSLPNFKYSLLILLFQTPNQSYTYLVYNLWLVGSQDAQKILEVQLTICKLYLQLVVFSKPLKILPARGTRPNKNECKYTLVKSDSKQCKTTTWSAEK